MERMRAGSVVFLRDSTRLPWKMTFNFKWGFYICFTCLGVFFTSFRPKVQKISSSGGANFGSSPKNQKSNFPFIFSPFVVNFSECNDGRHSRDDEHDDYNHTWWWKKVVDGDDDDGDGDDDLYIIILEFILVLIYIGI